MSPEMLKYCRGARNRYRNYLDERKIQDKIGEEEAISQKRDVKKLRKESDELSTDAEKKGKLSLLTESNKKLDVDPRMHPRCRHIGAC